MATCAAERLDGHDCFLSFVQERLWPVIRVCGAISGLRFVAPFADSE